MDKDSPKVLTQLDMLVGDLMGEVLETVERCFEEDYISLVHRNCLKELATELAEQWEEDLEG